MRMRPKMVKVLTKWTQIDMTRDVDGPCLYKAAFLSFCVLDQVLVFLHDTVRGEKFLVAGQNNNYIKLMGHGILYCSGF